MQFVLYTEPVTDISMRYILNGKQTLPENSSKSYFVNSEANGDEDWEYPGWGSIYEKVINKKELPKPIHKHQLNAVQSTAISGNDLLASVLYTTGIVCSACGQLAPIVMLLCCIALYPYRKIFKECGLCLPLNGGVYVAMLNSASKIAATFAASCSLIAYSATAVVSAASCTSYASEELGSFPVVPVTIAIMGLFAVLVLLGVKDSANVAMTIFCIHVMTLVVLIITSYVKIFETNGEILIYNWNQPLPVSSSGGIGMDLYLGFSVALLGLTGFETSANYIEGNHSKVFF